MLFPTLPLRVGGGKSGKERTGEEKKKKNVLGGHSFSHFFLLMRGT